MIKKKLDKDMNELDMLISNFKRPNNLEDISKALGKLRDLKIRLESIEFNEVSFSEHIHRDILIVDPFKTIM